MFKIQNHKSGLILVDIILALTLATLFVVIITQSSRNLRDVFESARERNRLLDVYEQHASEFEDLMPYESRVITFDADGWNTSTTTIGAIARWYGNDRIQTDVTISTESPGTFATSTTGYSRHITFDVIRNFSFTNINNFAGTPLCSVDFTNKEVVGSYSFQRDLNLINTSTFLSLKSPQSLVPTITPITLPVNPLLPLTDIEARNGVVYISSDSPLASDPDLFIIDIKDPKHAQIISSINTGPGIASITLAGNRVFAAAASTATQLHVIRLDGLNLPILEKKYQLPLPYATATPPLASSIFYNKNHVFIGTTKWDGNEFSIIDVSNPVGSVQISGLETGSQINDIFVRDNIAYITGSDQQQLSVVNIHNLSNPSLLASFSPSGWQRQEGKALSFFEDSLNMTRTSGGFNIKQDHELFSWATTSLAELNSGIVPSDSFAPKSVDISGGAYGVVTDRSYIYVATRQLNKEFQIFDQNLSTTTAKTFSLPALPQTMTCDGDYLYILANNAPVIYQILFK